MDKAAGGPCSDIWSLTPVPATGLTRPLAFPGGRLISNVLMKWLLGSSLRVGADGTGIQSVTRELGLCLLPALQGRQQFTSDCIPGRNSKVPPLGGRRLDPGLVFLAS